MSGVGDDTAEPVAAEAHRLSLGELFARLIDEAGQYVRAEVRLYRAQAARKAFSAGLIVALVGGAIMLTQALLVTLSVGTVLLIAPTVGTGWALLIVVIATILLIALCIMIARARISSMTKAEDMP